MLIDLRYAAVLNGIICLYSSEVASDQEVEVQEQNHSDLTQDAGERYLHYLLYAKLSFNMVC